VDKILKYYRYRKIAASITAFHDLLQLSNFLQEFQNWFVQSWRAPFIRIADLVFIISFLQPPLSTNFSLQKINYEKENQPFVAHGSI
jgi:hypothetical protein